MFVKDDTFDLTFFKFGAGVFFRTILFIGTFLVDSDDEGGENIENGGFGTDLLRGIFLASKAFSCLAPFLGELGTNPLRPVSPLSLEFVLSSTPLSISPSRDDCQLYRSFSWNVLERVDLTFRR